MGQATFNRNGFLIILIVIFISRLPFVNAGFGGEEDAWGLALTAQRIATTGQYEVSRLPGHPVQELIYSALSNQPPVVHNTITALFSTIATGLFMLILLRLGISVWLPAGLAFAFTPVIYINSTNAMDYMWTQAVVLAGFYLLLYSRPGWCGVMTGIAAGCRITALAMLVPFAFWLLNPENKKKSVADISLMIVTAFVVSLLVYYPVYSTYGFAFFDYTARIPAPFDKAIYRATAGTWGVIGFLDLAALIAAGAYIRFRTKANFSVILKFKKIAGFSVLVIAIYTLSFTLLPHKAAFFIPVIPFVFILIGVMLPSRFITAFSFSMILSSFFVSINLDRPDRSATPSDWSLKTEFLGRPVVIDFLHGPVIAEHTKRLNKIEASKKMAAAVHHLKKPSVIIAGFWMNDVLYQSGRLPEQIQMVYYESEDSLQSWKHQGKEIYFLPEQDEFNDKCFKSVFTGKYAEPLPIR
ncbi:MAG: hypothetical protein LC117_09535 [Bacteroidia bacterium]|nr:hypothetical protein [Bacteroidia bacterium]MCZ2278155.1 hypothetical protein [Bacteroidia bacterium]